jgi:hypothetical protein
MNWADAIAGPLHGATCLWQDLDGLHQSAAPPQAPPTSILWAWTSTDLIRVRLDGDTAYIATQPSASGHPTEPWTSAPGRVAAAINHPQSGPLLNATWEQLVIHDVPHGTGPITFIRRRP